MNKETFIERLFPLLITGDRCAARALVAESIKSGWTPEEIAEEGFWSVLESIQTLYRNDQMTNIAFHYATRLLRSLVDQVQAGYTQKSSNGKSILLFCGPTESDDLAAQIVVDLCEADGWKVRFGGVVFHQTKSLQKQTNASQKRYACFLLQLVMLRTFAASLIRSNQLALHHTLRSL